MFFSRHLVYGVLMTSPKLRQEVESHHKQTYRTHQANEGPHKPQFEEEGNRFGKRVCPLGVVDVEAGEILVKLLVHF